MTNELELALAVAFAKGNDRAALQLMRLWKLPLNDKGFKQAAIRMKELVPGFPDAVQWEAPEANETAIQIFANIK